MRHILLGVGLLVGLGWEAAAQYPIRTMAGLDGTGTVGVVSVGTPGQCEQEAVTTVAISQIASTQLITGTASEVIYVCSLVIVAGGAEIIALTSGTGTTCGTGASALLGSTTVANGMSLAANGSLVLPASKTHYAEAGAAGDNLCLLQDGIDRLAGSLTYVSR